MDDILAIVPARGGSVGIPRKNVRVIDGKPLVLHKLLALRTAGFERIVCSTNDPVIAAIAHIHGFEVHDRVETAGPAATIVETAREVVSALSWTGPVGIFQVTSPGLRPERIRAEVDDFLADQTLYTAASVTPVHDVLYTHDEQILYPGGGNRQDQKYPTGWRETGGIRLFREAEDLAVGIDPAGHKLIELHGAEAIDIDDHADLAAVRQGMHRSRVTFTVAVGREIGSGHLHRCLTLADELAHHEILFRFDLRDADPELVATAADMVTGSGYRLDGPAGTGRGDAFWVIRDLGPGVHVFDVLEADPAEVATNSGRVVLLEDLGPAAPLAALVVNELYDEGDAAGPGFAVLRPEFLVDGPHQPTYDTGETQPTVLVCFGGTDPAGMTPLVARALNAAGLRTRTYGGLGLPGKDPVPIAQAMAESTILVTAQGRTVHEAARVGIPTISIPVNAREATHARLDSVHYLPRAELALDDVVPSVRRLIAAPRLRREMSERGRELVDGRGAQRIARMIDQLAEGL